ncbi:RelA/SpoT family protein [Helcococcus kunzii]|uniref:RelA/SpoT family protein n=1 Tax=Helcococcus kunzii TaxID=40091 RepID=UPI001BAF0D25|nr:bifunctional (p)ppGpp synthetase/guanosine-3',5'-bis(diphosphate) 3'-pyrophosphohydrolase [Helcococcus kunzii]MCT1795492.1 bifunctional (p)ppGpp synthetase/guanosine-3',5'-bis(diphosphate) 3'-pyrophosphohydrolase [Helcococcus kunzii]MCT1989172.1 bifunctional (p)ppGpp synthetase/guanosine-3',5'-bis(diphosphate) 3'-pyrophosphohydrolase [Helcococcus kunzii]QUY64738.1 bifunctional (p)ppGpp synthetase/guanosine-3',5'-bis(diphosphate) 3'-pyrophosphohydrolase [Helcococcus kunzii]
MLDRIIESIKKYNKNPNIELITKAYNLAKEKHKGQVRNSGEEYIVHPVEVSIILSTLELDDETICAGLMHDVLEDTDFTREEMAQEFGDEITALVDGVTKLKNLKYKTKEETQIESIRKMVLAMANDIRVIIIKLADRLHNMRTLEYKDRDKQISTANETLEIYVPLAHRLGINSIKWELEDLCLRYIDPISYYSVAQQIDQKRSEREKIIEKLMQKLSDELKKIDIKFTMTGRPKGIYSIYNKMKKQDTSIDNIFDLIAIRVIVKDINQCYAVLGIVHNLWKPIPGRFKDYIAMPKPNFYQSLHTTVIGEKGQIFEVQIRTEEMHKNAEFGIASHWQYKEGKKKVSNLDNRLNWIRQLIDWGKDTGAYEFMDGFKGDLFNDEVYVFTPKGDVIDLKKGATPIDFAYRVHSEVGDKCVGAKVNGKIQPLDYKLKTGDIVTVLTSKNSIGPNLDWLDYVVTSHAKNKIKAFFKKKTRDIDLELGKEMLEKEVKKRDYESSDLLKKDWLSSIAERLNNNPNIDSLYSAIGNGAVNVETVVKRLITNYEKVYKIEEKDENIVNTSKDNVSLNKNINDGIVIDDITNLDCKFAKCCNPVPGDKVIGYITNGHGVTIHRSNCKNILNLQNKERLIEVKWNKNDDSQYPVSIVLVIMDKTGYLADLTKVLSKEGFDIASINSKMNDNATITINLSLMVKSAEDVKRILSAIRKVDGTLNVYRERS